MDKLLLLLLLLFGLTLFIFNNNLVIEHAVNVYTQKEFFIPITINKKYDFDNYMNAYGFDTKKLYDNLKNLDFNQLKILGSLLIETKEVLNQTTNTDIIYQLYNITPISNNKSYSELLFDMKLDVSYHKNIVSYLINSLKKKFVNVNINYEYTLILERKPSEVIISYNQTEFKNYIPVFINVPHTINNKVTFDKYMKIFDFDTQFLYDNLKNQDFNQLKIIASRMIQTRTILNSMSRTNNINTIYKLYNIINTDNTYELLFNEIELEFKYRKDFMNYLMQKLFETKTARFSFQSGFQPQTVVWG